MNPQVHVTLKDIREGSPCNSGKCPVARAVCRIFPGRLVHVCDGQAQVFTSERIFFYTPPLWVWRWIREYDALGDRFRPNHDLETFARWINKQESFTFTLIEG